MGLINEFGVIALVESTRGLSERVIWWLLAKKTCARLLRRSSKKFYLELPLGRDNCQSLLMVSCIS